MRRREGHDPKKERGGKRMLRLGYKSSQLWLNSAEYLVALEAARFYAMPLAKYLRLAALSWIKENHHPGGGRLPTGLDASKDGRRG